MKDLGIPICKTLTMEQEPSKDAKKVRGWRREKPRAEYQKQPRSIIVWV